MAANTPLPAGRHAPAPHPGTDTLDGMDHCTATGTITLDGRPAAVICNRRPHDPDETHNDAVLGDWPDEE